ILHPEGKDLIHHHFGEKRKGESNEEKEQGGPQYLQNGGWRLLDVLSHVRTKCSTGRGCLAIESGSWFEGDDHPCKAGIKLLVGQAATPSGRINHINTFARPALHDHKVIELPMDNGGKFDEAEIIVLQ